LSTEKKKGVVEKGGGFYKPLERFTYAFNSASFPQIRQRPELEKSSVFMNLF